MHTRSSEIPEYRALLSKALEEGGISIPLSSAEEARNLRSYLYHYRAFLRREDSPFYLRVKKLKFLIHPHALEITLPRPPQVAAILEVLSD